MAEYDFLKNTQETLEGFEGINNTTMAIPFLKLAQALSPEINKNKPEYIPGLEEGFFFNSATKEIFKPGDPLEIVILKFERIYIEWLPKRAGFVSYHTPENAERLCVNPDEFGKWKTENGNLLQEYYSYYCIIVGHEDEGPVILSLKSTSIKTGKELNRLMMTHKMDDGQLAMPFFLVWNLTAEYTTKVKGSWFMPVFRFSRYITEEILLAVKKERKALPNKNVDYALIDDGTQTGTVDPDDEDF